MCSERASLAQVVRQEFAEQLAASQEETQRVKAELAELRARQQMELDEVHRRWVVRTAGRVQRTSHASSCLLQTSRCSPWQSSHGFHLCARMARRFPWASLSSRASPVSGLGKTQVPSPRRCAGFWLEQVLFSRGPAAERVTVASQNLLSPSRG